MDQEEVKTRPASVRRRSKQDLIQLFLDQLATVKTREDAASLTELLLERYKGLVISIEF